MMSKFKVGDIVTINPESDFSGEGDQHPIGIEGRVEWVGELSSLVYIVSWDGGRWSVYNDEELLLVDSFEGNE